MNHRQGRRNWKLWHRRYIHAVSTPEILVGLVSLSLTIFGTFASQPQLQITGIILLLGILILIAIRSLPERLLSVPSLATSQEQVTLGNLQELDTPVLRIGTVGERQSGKSTFLHHALHRPPTLIKTTRIEIRIVPVPNVIPQMFCALIDGDGAQLSQQFDVCEHVDLLFVFLDHNPGDQDTTVSANRLPAHDNFLSQLRAHLNREGVQTPRHIHFVLNKRDLWQTNVQSERTLASWFCDTVTAWRDYGMAPQVTASYHSNLDAADVTNMLRRIKDSVPN